MPARHAAVLGAALAIASSACSAPDAQKTPGSVARAPAVTPPPPAPPPPALPPEPRVLAAPPLVALPVDGHLDAVVAVPVGATDRRPIAVATHGNYDAPQWTCPLWRDILGPDVFILCPRGVPRPDQPPPRTPEETVYTYDSPAALAAEIDAGLAALRARFGAFVDDGPALYAGCSRGAFLGAAIGPPEAARFPRLALVEGGHDPWTPANARRFAEGGGERVLFTCGQYACFAAASEKARLLRAAGVEANVAYAPLVGHLCHDRVAAETKRALPWLVAGDARWRAAP